MSLNERIQARAERQTDPRVADVLRKLSSEQIVFGRARRIV